MPAFFKIIPFIAASTLQMAAVAHEVLVQVVDGPPRQVRLAYSNGEPFSYELYEFIVDGEKMPVQTGRTDSDGAALLPTLPAQTASGHALRLRAFSADGHGVDMLLDLSTKAAATETTRAAATTTSTSTSQPPADARVQTAIPFLQDRSRLLRAVLGTALIVAGAGIYVALQRRKKKR